MLENIPNFEARIWYVDLEILRNSPVGHLTPIHGTDGRTRRTYQHMAFVPERLRDDIAVQAKTWKEISRANRALGRLDQASLQIPNPALLRRPTLRREAQSTSALEGTFAPLEQVLSDGEAQGNKDLHEVIALREVFNYVKSAEHAFQQVENGYGITPGMLEGAQKTLVEGTPSEKHDAGVLRSVQVGIGAGKTSIEDAKFVPMPPGIELRAAFQDLIDWTNSSQDIDPVMAAAMTHYQFEALHPFTDGNGRIGRLLIVLQLICSGTIQLPLLTVSPWFEGNRDEYQDRLFDVSATGNWDGWIEFFSRGLAASAEDTRARVEDLLNLQQIFIETLQGRQLRSGLARDIVSKLIGFPSFTIPTMTKLVGNASAQGVTNAVRQLVDIGILEKQEHEYRHRYVATEVIDVLIRPSTWVKH